jgi:hypothetical protein
MPHVGLLWTAFDGHVDYSCIAEYSLGFGYSCASNIAQRFAFGILDIFVVRSTPTTPVLWLPIVGAPQGILRLAILYHRRLDATSAVSLWYTCTPTTRSSSWYQPHARVVFFIHGGGSRV